MSHRAHRDRGDERGSPSRGRRSSRHAHQQQGTRRAALDCARPDDGPRQPAGHRRRLQHGERRLAELDVAVPLRPASARGGAQVDGRRRIRDAVWIDPPDVQVPQPSTEARLAVCEASGRAGLERRRHRVFRSPGNLGAFQDETTRLTLGAAWIARATAEANGDAPPFADWREGSLAEAKPRYGCTTTVTGAVSLSSSSVSAGMTAAAPRVATFVPTPAAAPAPAPMAAPLPPPAIPPMAAPIPVAMPVLTASFFFVLSASAVNESVFSAITFDLVPTTDRSATVRLAVPLTRPPGSLVMT